MVRIKNPSKACVTSEGYANLIKIKE